MASTDSSYDQEQELQQQGSNREDAESSSRSQVQESDDEESIDVGGKPSWGDGWEEYCSQDHETTSALSISPLAGITMCSEKLLLNHIRQDGQDENHLIISMGQIRAGYQFPLYDPTNPLLLRLLKYINKHPAQLSGNSIRILYEWVARSNGYTLYPNVTRNPSFAAKELYTVENFIDQYQIKPSSRAGEPWLYRLESRRGSALENSKKFLRDVDRKTSTSENPTVRHKSENRWGEIPCQIEGPWLKGFEDENKTIPRKEFLPEHSDLANHNFWSVRWDEEDQYLKKDGEFVVGEKKKWVKKSEFCKPPTIKGKGIKRKGKDGDAVEQPKKKSKPAVPVSAADRVKGLMAGALPGMNTAGSKKNDSVKSTGAAAKKDNISSKKKDSSSSKVKDDKSSQNKDGESSKNNVKPLKTKKTVSSKTGSQSKKPNIIDDPISDDQSVKPAGERHADEVYEETPITPPNTTSTTATTGRNTAEMIVGAGVEHTTEMHVDTAGENTVEMQIPDESNILIESASASATDNAVSVLHHLLSMKTLPCTSVGGSSSMVQPPANKLVDSFAKLLSQDENGANTLYLESMSKLSEPGLALKPVELTTAVSHLTPYEQFCSAVMDFQRNVGSITLNAQLKQELDNVRQAKAKLDQTNASLQYQLGVEKKESSRMRINFNQEKKKVEELQEKYKQLELQLKEQTTTLKEHSGCTAKITELEGQVKDHQLCRDKLHALETIHMQCTGKITNLENDVKALQDYKMKFDDEASKSAKLQRMHDTLKSELNLTKKSVQTLEEERASDVRIAGFYAVQMYLEHFCPDHDLDIPDDYAPGRGPPVMENIPGAANDEDNAENAIQIHSGSDSEEEIDEEEEEICEEEDAEGDRDLQPKSHGSHQDSGKDADANDGNQDSSKDPNMAVDNP